MLDLLYHLGYRFHSRYMGKKRKRLEGYTVSVGNITLGGTGKTPIVMEIARKAKDLGLRTCILTRGYGAKSREPLIVSRGEGPVAEWSLTGDEPYLMAKKLKGVWVVKDSNRYRGGLLGGSKDLFILDDGFQHWALHRDMDILGIDATRPFGNGRLLPFGPMREPLSSLARADIIVINKTTVELPELVVKLRKYNRVAPIFYSYYVIESISNLQHECISLEELKGLNCFLFTGIGNPLYLKNMLSSRGVRIAGQKMFRDHHVYRMEEIQNLLKEAERVEAGVLLTTEKDMVKLDPILEGPLRERIYSVNIRTVVVDRPSERLASSDEFYELIFGNLRKKEEEL